MRSLSTALARAAIGLVSALAERAAAAAVATLEPA